jgi:hypothetical protein
MPIVKRVYHLPLGAHSSDEQQQVEYVVAMATLK